MPISATVQHACHCTRSRRSRCSRKPPRASSHTPEHAPEAVRFGRPKESYQLPPWWLTVPLPRCDPTARPAVRAHRACELHAFHADFQSRLVSCVRAAHPAASAGAITDRGSVLWAAQWAPSESRVGRARSLGTREVHRASRKAGPIAATAFTATNPMLAVAADRSARESQASGGC